MERGKVNKTRAELKGMREGGQDKLAAFGNWMPKLVAEVRKNKKFKKLPIGPLGSLIKITENTDKALARAVEHELSGLLTAFLCDSSADQRELFAMFGRLRLPFKPVVFTCPFTTERHNVSHACVRSDRFTTLIECLDIEDSNVFNRVVDSAALERILYIPSTQEAQNLLGSPVSVPQNLYFATVANTHQYYPAPNYRAYHRDDKSRGLLKANLAELIIQREDQLKEEEAGVERVERAIKQTSEEKISHGKMIDAEESKLRLINNKICDLNNKLGALRNEDENEAPVDIAALGDDLDLKKEQMEEIDRKLEAVTEELNQAQEQAMAAKNKFNEAGEENRNKRENIEPMNEELSTVETGIKKAKRDKDHYAVKKEEYKKHIVEMEELMAGKKASLDDLESKARMWAVERVPSRKKVDSLAREITKMEESMKKQEETQEPRELVTQKFESLTVIYGKAQGQVKYMEKTVEYLGTMLGKRKSGFKFILSTTGKNINRNFTTQLDARKYIGMLQFDHKSHTLTINVNPDSSSNAAALDINRDIRTLSGGEKSYSSVSLILALWDAMNPPFRVLDEFDVFMDAVNRRVSLTNIINYAKTDRKYQFIFLTPLNTDNIDVGADLKIIKLAKRAS